MPSTIEPTLITELRPKASSFVFARVGPALMLLAVAGVSAAVATAVWAPGFVAWPIAVCAVLVAFILVDARAAVGKERYLLGETDIVASGGGLFTDRQVDLDLRNVTHVRQRLSWLRYRFFNVGDVLIESAGSGSSEVVLRSVRDPDAVYALVKERLRQNGFSLRAMELLHEEHPDTTGVAVEVLGMLTGTALLTTWIAVSVVLEFGGGADAVRQILRGNTTGIPVGVVTAALYVLPLLLLGSSALYALLHFLDLKRRTYRVFDDMVVYEEGFLDRTNAFIPRENIADADLAQTLLDQVLGLSDVKVSCQGSGQEVKFRRLRRGPALKAAVAKLVRSADAARHVETVETIKNVNSEPGSFTPGAQRTNRRAARAAAPSWTATLRPLPQRAAAGALGLLPLLPLWLVVTIAEWVRANATQHTVGRTSVGTRTGIMNISEREFAYDKVTGVVVRSSPFDRWFDTVGIEIWSIGSMAPLMLTHIPRADVDVPALLANLGIDDSPTLRRCLNRFNFGVWLRAAVPGFVVLSAITAALAIVPVIANEPVLAGFTLPLLALTTALYIWRQAWTARQVLTLHADHLELQSGLWWRAHHYVRYEHIKKTSVTRYPGGKEGTLTLFVAGERVVQQNNQKQGVPVPYTVTAPFMADTRTLADHLDAVLDGTREPDALTPVASAAVVLERRPAVINAVAGTLLISLLMPPLVVVLVPLAWARARRCRYCIERHRVRRTDGLLYRTTSSVLLSRIDSMRQDQGALGKVFGNGQVTILTAGSSRPDMILDALPGHREAYRLLQESYREAERARLTIQTPATVTSPPAMASGAGD